MRTTNWLAGLALTGASAAALAATPSYDYLQVDYVGVNRHDSTFDFQGADLQVSALIAPYLFFGAGYEFLQSDRFQEGLVTGRLQQHTANAGLGGRIPLVPNVLDATIGADYVYTKTAQKDGFEGVFADGHDSGYQVKGSVRANFRYFEVIPTVRYVNVNHEETGIGIQVLGCPGYGICLTAGYEYLKRSEDHRYFAGVRFYYD